MTHRPDPERIIKECEWAIERIEDYGSTTMMSRSFFADVEKLLKNQPEIVRCKDCKYHDTYDCSITYLTTQKTPNDWFCADRKRKSD